ncbi:MAG: hypothetical protein M1514_00180 [Patescibacteria group bacterium]|nr:hypothetical protein [Patescibacteria group bacterium]
MDLNYQSLEADALANLYRAAFYLAKGAPETGLEFLKKAWDFWQKNSQKDLSMLKPLLEKQQNLNSNVDQRLWAEKILDCYHLLKTS